MVCVPEENGAEARDEEAAVEHELGHQHGQLDDVQIRQIDFGTHFYLTTNRTYVSAKDWASQEDGELIGPENKALDVRKKRPNWIDIQL